MLNNRYFRSVRALRYTVAFSFIVAAASGGTSIYLMQRLSRGNSRLTQIDHAVSDSISLYAAGLQMCQATRNILLDPSNPTAYKNHAAAAKDYGEILSGLQRQIGELFPGSEAGQAMASIKSDFEAHLAVQHDIHELSRRGEFEQAKAELNAKDTPLWRKYKQSMQDSRQWLERQTAQVAAEIQAGCRTAVTLSWVCALILAAAALGAFLMSGLVGHKLGEVSQSLAEGADQIARAAGQVARSSRSLAEGATEQAASLEETSASTEEISSMVRRNDESLQSAAALAVESHERLSETNRALDQTVAAIGEINDSSGKISRIIKVIDEIAFQTNILALNAAVEAARAGEAGMGFGVVADEVRNLAQRCAQAARDTTALIEESVTKARDGNAKVDQVAVSIRSLAAGSSRIQTLLEEVSQGARQHTAGIDQIARAMAQMDRATQVTAASAEEDAAAAAELDAHSRTLNELVEDLTATISGK